ncbi:MAG TPA: S8 family serine peptidase, partial [Patescibacteria group bacterium]|nr:S8 family serine peptidase [Patescibacteria group bacterium]
MIRSIRTAALGLALCVGITSSALPDAYVTPASTYRWDTAAGIRFNDVGGIRFNDVGGIRFNDVGGIRFNDVGGLLFSDTSGIRFNDVGGIRFNDVGGITFNKTGSGPSIDLSLLNLLVTLPDTSAIGVIITYQSMPTALDLNDLRSIGITGGTVFANLPMVVVNATKDQIIAVAAFAHVRSIWQDRLLTWVTHESLEFIGVRQAEADPAMRTTLGLPFDGRGVTIAFVDTGIDATHPDLPFGSKVLQNVRVHTAAGNPAAFLPPAYTEGLPNTDLVLGHGTFGAGIAAGTGSASGGYYRGVAPGAGLVGISVGDVYIVNVLEGFDYLLSNALRY